MRIYFNRLFSREATLSAIRQTVSGSESELSVLRGTCQTSQKGCDGSERTTSQDKVLNL